MLSKILKRDLAFVAKNTIIFAVLAILFSIITRLTATADTNLGEILTGIFRGTAISLAISMLFNTVIRIWVRICTDFYGAEAHFTHTIPVTKSTLYLSKFLCSCLMLLFNLLTMVLCAFIMFYSKQNIEVLKGFINGIAGAFNLSIPALIFMFFGLIFAEFLAIVLSGFLGIILGYKMSKAKVGFSILYGFLIYSCVSGFTLLAVAVSTLFIPNLSLIFASGTVPPDTIISACLICLTAYIIEAAAIYFAGLKIFKKGVNI